MSQQVLWEVIKNNNCFLVKKSGHSFSSDPFNNTSMQTYSNAGFISTQAVALSAGATTHQNNVRVQLRKKVKFQQKSKDAKAGKTAQKEAKHTVFSADLPVKHGVHTVAKIIKKRFGTTRVGLQKAALRKLVRLNTVNALTRKNLTEALKAQKK